MLFSSSAFSNPQMKDKFNERKDSLLRSSFQPHSLSVFPPPQLHKRECLSDEVDSRSAAATLPGAGSDIKKLKLLEDKPPAEPSRTGDGATIEVVKRPRGRPPGSKNKPKAPMVVTRESEPAAAMRPHVLEIPNGHDIVESLATFSRRRNLGISVLAGTGAVANVGLRQPSGAAGGGGGTIGFHGRFEILSISATFLPPAMAAISPPAAAAGGMSISLAGPHGQIVGGAVAGPLVAAGPVVVVVAAFTSPTFHRLPAEDDVSVSVSVSGGGEPDEPDHDRDLDRDRHVRHRQYQPPQEQQHEQGHVPAHVIGQTESCGMSIYSCHLPSEVIWAPTARPPHPPY